ncbi:TrkA family potassium uptake protein [Haloechinothrix sp. LS1_15]|uniref:potassium channel family protein n=1 Tax=Haloechinothrix sp. LS1_15 TaxID=2652248 RepID=UPI002944A9A6|nr:TrkA family potassium uptake protein [Haloechinothrix sp. LS1_15]MDV6014455.1 TrkA family potassium uptake protein [Haloechinothrix sp. LS1_15]
MRVAIAGAGAVGRSIALELLEVGHQVMLLERLPENFAPESVEAADWVLGDACEVSTLEEAGLQGCDVVIAATGDDKVNLVLSLLAKTEFAVRRVVARVNDPDNEWLFDQRWGVDVAVSTPRMLAAMVEEAVGIGDLVRLMTFRKGQANLVEITLPAGSALDGRPVSRLSLPADTTLVAVLRGDSVMVPTGDDPLHHGDELLFIAGDEAEDAIRHMVKEPER